MNLLIVGGSGLVGTMTIPILTLQHTVRVFDRLPPADDSGVEYVIGSVTDFNMLRDAAAGVDVVVYLAMNPKRDWGSPATVAAAFDVNIKGTYLALRAAAEQGVEHVVYASSMSVQRVDDRHRGEAGPRDADDFYGFTKGLGEDVCRNAVITRGMSVNALRLCYPTPDNEWPPTGTERRRITATRGSDVAAAFEAALHYRNGFEAFNISGDSDERYAPLGKAKRLLNWSPTC